MIYKKTPLALATLCTTITLTACGGGDSNTSNQRYSDGNNNPNEFAFEVFETKYDNQTNIKAIQRVTSIYSDGNEVTNHHNIIDTINRNKKDRSDLIVLSDNFEGKQRNQNIDVENNNIIFNIYSDTSNRKEYSILEMKKVNLTDVNSSSYNSATKTGIYTDLNRYKKIPSTAQFPKGSVCYIAKNTNSFAYFNFHKDNVSKHNTMKSWLNDHTNQKNLVRTESLKVGTAGQYDAVVAVYKSDLKKINISHAAVKYKGKIYEAEFHRKGQRLENTDKRKNGGVDCTVVNKVAADFLQDQIVQYY